MALSLIVLFGCVNQSKGKQMNEKLQKFLQGVDSGEIVINSYPLKGIITSCDEWITEGWRADSSSITGPMYAAALLNEAKTQDSFVINGESHLGYPRTLRMLAMKILEVDGHGMFNMGPKSFYIKY